MGSKSPLEEWYFLVSEWRGASSEPDEFGEEGIVESSHVFTVELDGAFVTGRHDAWQGDRPVNNSISLLYYDAGADVFRSTPSNTASSTTRSSTTGMRVL